MTVPSPNPDTSPQKRSSPADRARVPWVDRLEYAVRSRGAKVVVLALVANTMVAQLLRISSSYSPPPPEGFVSPMTWGMEDKVVERFTAAGISAGRIACERDTFVFAASVPPSEYLTWFRDYYGPTMNAFDAAESNGRADDLFGELNALFNAQNTTGDPDATAIPATFLRVTVNT